MIKNILIVISTFLLVPLLSLLSDAILSITGVSMNPYAQIVILWLIAMAILVFMSDRYGEDV